MTYFSAFSGIGGFEMGIQQAYEDIFSEKEKERIREKDEKTLRIKKDRHDNERDSRLDDCGTKSQQHFDGSSNRQSSCIGYSEIDKYAVKIYEHHFPEHKNYGDIAKIDWSAVPDFDLLTGGSPCQNFSIAGKREGIVGSESRLVWEYIRCLREKKPRYFIWENVRGVMSSRGGWDFANILTAFSNEGYALSWQVLNSKDFGVPQNRERVFVVGSRGESPPEVFFERADDTEADELPRHIANTLTSRYEGGQATGTYISEGELDAQEAGEQGLLEEGAVADHPDGRRGQAHTAIRRLTCVECARLQGFPDDWHKIEGISDTRAYQAYGNAVTVNVIREIVKRLIP